MPFVFKIPDDGWHWTQDHLNIRSSPWSFWSLVMITDVLCFSFIWAFHVKSGDRGGQWSDLARTNRLLVSSDILLIYCDGVDAVTRHIVVSVSVCWVQWGDSATDTAYKIIIRGRCSRPSEPTQAKMLLTLLTPAIFNFRLVHWLYWLRVFRRYPSHKRRVFFIS